MKEKLQRRSAVHEWITECDCFGKEKHNRLGKLDIFYGEVNHIKQDAGEGKEEPILELLVGADICHVSW